jgi:uncharacterized protein with HEPN domain
MRDERAYLFDIADSARVAMSYVAGKTYKQFLQDTLLQDAILRRLAIIGEAVRCISPETRNKLPELPWEEMAKMRNILVHVYFGVDMQIVWDTVTRDLGPLIEAIARLDDVETR